jgi:eukaryotic-like serine/threonine-protein kinase
MAKTGSQLDKYLLHEMIGGGGFANVYRATDTTLERDAAVKVLKEEFTKKPETRERFTQEAQKASGLKHDSIIRVYDLIDDPEAPAIAMEYLPAGDLHRWLIEHPRPSRKFCLNVLRQAAEALDYIHELNIVHRDVKPSNLLLASVPASDDSVSIRLSDFGLVMPTEARMAGPAGRLTGSALYVSPEQARNQSVDKFSDQYSLGIVAYELLVGRPPFEVETNDITALMAKRIKEAPPVPSTVNAEVPSEVDRVLLQALALEPKDRFASCGAFVDALDAALRNSDQRRFVELRQEARELTAQDKFDLARQKLEEARRLMNTGDLQLDFDYLDGAEAWKDAIQKAKLVLGQNAIAPDPQGIFMRLGLRAPQRRFPTREELSARLTRDQVTVGLILTGVGVAVLIYFAYRWLIR